MAELSGSAAVTSAIILAGGQGTRLRRAVPNVPKPMAPVNNRPFLEHQIDYWIEQGIRHFTLSVGYRREVIMGHFGAEYRGAQIDYVVEEAPLGTGGALMLAVKQVNDGRPFLLLNGDTYFEVKLPELAGFHAKRKSDLTFSLFATGDTKRYMGMEQEIDGRITGLHSRSGAFANGGVYLVNPQILQALAWDPGNKLSLEDDIMPMLLTKGARIFGHTSNGRFIDIGVPEDYLRSAKILASLEAD